LGKKRRNKGAEPDARERGAKSETPRRIEHRADHAGIVEPAKPGGEKAEQKAQCAEMQIVLPRRDRQAHDN
jgi:hypothetical protein